MDKSSSNPLDVPDHAAIREGVRAVVTRFDDEYWLARDEDGEFPPDSIAPWPMPAGLASPCRRNMAVRPWRYRSRRHDA